MEAELFDAMHAHAERHWWFRGRQKVALTLIERFYNKSGGRVLDLGCGTGVNLPALARFGEVWGCDPSAQALAFCKQRHRGRLDEIWLPERVPYEDESFDLIVMLDVLEHVEDDKGAAERIARLLKPGGLLVLTVPALRWLWSKHDTAHHHFRRYHRPDLRARLEGVGLATRKLSYFNSFLLPAMALARVLKLEGGGGHNLESGTRGPAAWLLGKVFASERHWLKFARFPLGGSLIAVCERPADLKLEPWKSTSK